MFAFCPQPGASSTIDGSCGGNTDRHVHVARLGGQTVRPCLASALRDRGFTVWLDEHELIIGQSLRAQIDTGLRRSRFGVVVISKSFFEKRWPQMELDGLLALDEHYSRIFPILLDVDHSFVSVRSPTLAGRKAVLAESANPDYNRVI